MPRGERRDRRILRSDQLVHVLSQVADDRSFLAVELLDQLDRSERRLVRPLVFDLDLDNYLSRNFFEHLSQRCNLGIAVLGALKRLARLEGERNLLGERWDIFEVHVSDSSLVIAHSLEVIVVEKDYFAILGNAHICLNDVDALLDRILESGKGVLRSFHAAAAMRHQTRCKLASLLLTIVGLRQPDL